MGLILNRAEYVFITAAPHSVEAMAGHPLGLIPSGVTPSGQCLFESASLAKAIDLFYPHSVASGTPCLDGSCCPKRDTLLFDFGVQLYVSQMVSIISDSVFRTLEHQLIKVRFALEADPSNS